jgi:hypothetical protein
MFMSILKVKELLFCVYLPENQMKRSGWYWRLKRDKRIGNNF